MIARVVNGPKAYITNDEIPRGSVVVEALSYKPEGRGISSR
jgi:hypothetical protein